MPRSVIIVGGGWAGLSCAYELAKHRYTITLLEAAPQLGGRARSVQFGEYLVDNGQHIAIGAYHTLREILGELNLKVEALFEILPLQIITHGTLKSAIKTQALPSPFHIVAALLTARNWSWHNKRLLLKFCRQIATARFRLAQDCTVLELLKNYHQSDFCIQYFWEPIALAALTTPISTASAQVFLEVLRLSFTGKRSNSNWWLPKVDLSAILPNHLENFLALKGAQIQRNQAIKNLVLQDQTCIAINNPKHTWQANHIVLATSAWQAAKLCQPHPALTNLTEKLNQISYQPITTIYFAFAQKIELPFPIYGLVGTNSQWIVNRACADQPQIISAVISGPLKDKITDKNNLINLVWQELISYFPWLPTPIKSKAICEKQAAFNCDVATQALRPTPTTNISNLWLSGDYLQTGLPATLEGALLSGKQTAHEILKSG